MSELFTRNRLIGLAFALPLAWFWIRRKIPAGYKPRLLALLALGGLQGAVGWWMVASGLVDRTEVAPERLAVHLSNAFIIMAGCIWTALDLIDGDAPRAHVRLPSLRCRRDNNTFDSASTQKVMKNRIRPRYISEAW